MGWLQLVGSLKLQVSFAKEPYKRDVILQKRPINFKEPTFRSHHITKERLLHPRIYIQIYTNTFVRKDIYTITKCV